MADGPNQVWSWDITKLHGPAKWTYYYLYVILDIYSRCGRAGCGVLEGSPGVRAPGDDAAVVWDGAVALVSVRLGGRGAVGSGDAGRGP